MKARRTSYKWSELKAFFPIIEDEKSFVDEFLEITKREVELLKYGAKIRRNPKPTASLYCLPEEGYTKPVSFSSQDLSDEKTFYFQEDQEVPDCLKFDIINKELEVAFVESDIINDFNERYHNKYSSEKPSFILSTVNYSTEFQRTNLNPFHGGFRLLESAIMKRISINNYYTYKELIRLTKNYKLIIVNSDNYESLLVKLAKSIFRKCRNAHFPRIIHCIPLNKIITPKLFYTYPTDEEDKGPTLSWPLLQKAV